jgi:hypothetical protein
MADLEMVVTGRGDRWLCVMGDVEREVLAAIAAAAAF